jgi:hypothetical protein
MPPLRFGVAWSRRICWSNPLNSMYVVHGKALNATDQMRYRRDTGASQDSAIDYEKARWVTYFLYSSSELSESSVSSTSSVASA